MRRPFGRGTEGKYNVRPKEERTYRGRVFHSKSEARYAAELDLRVRAGDIGAWRPQVRFPLVVNGVRVTSYTADFEVTAKDGTITYVEVKGFPTDAAELRRKLWQALFPQYRLEIVSVRT